MKQDATRIIRGLPSYVQAEVRSCLRLGRKSETPQDNRRTRARGRRGTSLLRQVSHRHARGWVAKVSLGFQRKARPAAWSVRPRWLRDGTRAVNRRLCNLAGAMRQPDALIYLLRARCSCSSSPASRTVAPAGLSHRHPRALSLLKPITGPAAARSSAPGPAHADSARPVLGRYSLPTFSTSLGLP
jgi:hypothetical protein